MSTHPLANALGAVGAVTILVGFGWQTLRGAPPDLLSLAANLFGALLLAASLTIDVNLPSLALELAWALIALVGLVRLMRVRA